VVTTNGAIRGSYIAVKSINLETTNGPIKVRAEVKAEALNVSTTNAPIQKEYSAGRVASLKTTNALVEAEVEAREITVKTSNGRINGSYLAEGLVDIRTTNAQIDIGEGKGEEVVLRSTNGRILGDYVIGKRFDAETSNGLIEVHVGLKEEAQAPEVKAMTSHSRMQVVLSNTFAGHFDVLTTHGRATVQNCLDYHDQCDQSDIVFERDIRTAKSGTKGSHGQGSTLLQSKNGDAELFFV